MPAEQLCSPSSPQQGAALEAFSLLTPTCLPKTPLFPPQPGRRTLFSSHEVHAGGLGAAGRVAAGRAPAAGCSGLCWELVPAVLAQGSAAEPAPAPPAAPSPGTAAQTRPCLTRGPFPGRAAMPPVFPGWENITCSSRPLLFHCKKKKQPGVHTAPREQTAPFAQPSLALSPLFFGRRRAGRFVNISPTPGRDTGAQAEALGGDKPAGEPPPDEASVLLCAAVRNKARSAPREGSP